jgi:UDP-glucose 4-epimerase
MQRVAVTGCAGGFASTLLPLLEADPEIEQIVGIDRLPPAQTYEKLHFHRYDIRDPQLREALTGCDALLHLAFIVLRPFSVSLQETASINLAGTWNVCRAAAEAGVRKLIVSSSIAAYGNLSDNPPVLHEESPLRGLYTDFYYSQHKHANEIWLDGFQWEFPDLLVSRPRPCVVIGPHQLSARALIQPNRTYFSTTSARRGRSQLVHEDDLASALHVMIRHDLPGAYNVVGDGVDSMPNIATHAGLQVIEVQDELFLAQLAQLWQQGASAAGPEWARGDTNIVCSNDKLKATGLWSPRYDTNEAFAATIRALL